MIKTYMENVRKSSPLIHNITNYVTANDVANILIACGGSPIMADDEAEVEEITALCGGLNINIGTLNSKTIPSMLKAGKKASELSHPIILDPVGAGASSFRTKTALDLISNIKFTVIRGNISEVKVLALGEGGAKGVDANISDKITNNTVNSTIEFAKAYSKKTGAVIAISGEIDIICNSNKAYIIDNGHPMMSKITGSGCMLTALTAAYITANQDNILEAAAAATIAMGICGELAYERLCETGGGNSTYRNYLIDAMSNLDGCTIERKAKYEIY